ncbi:KpsF/GutQ family sugar-phosphate isomerase [Candidatus Acidulodesulfobacterium sp. H_13]|uniref:KpsF/GutQ family sugar-phosphate isomerase n=1 Tax=Candidatus Acidulodesulfobacterium sp. H_13 TaxID=3395470 RepID=UPI003AF55AEF
MHDILETATDVLKVEADSIMALTDRLDENFERMIDCLIDITGKVILTGMGKSGIIARKISSTLASTGTPSFFMHPAEASHGDLGVISSNDAVIILSNSGNTREIVSILPAIKFIGAKVIGFSGNKNSRLFALSDYFFDISVKKEACPYNLAPTASTTVQLAIGDALAVSLLKKRNFLEEDFAKLHPGGSIGKKFLKVIDIMHRGNEVPLVKDSALLKDAIIEMNSKRLGLTGVIDDNLCLCGIIVDGDLRRALLGSAENIIGRSVRNIMTKNPKTILKDTLAVNALRKMEDLKITSLFAVESADDNRPVGVIHIHDIVKAGII